MKNTFIYIKYKDPIIYTGAFKNMGNIEKYANPVIIEIVGYIVEENDTHITVSHSRMGKYFVKKNQIKIPKQNILERRDFEQLEEGMKEISYDDIRQYVGDKDSLGGFHSEKEGYMHESEIDEYNNNIVSAVGFDCSSDGVERVAMERRISDKDGQHIYRTVTAI